MPARRCRTASLLSPALLCAAVLFGCATPSQHPATQAAAEEDHDPLEPMNRYFFEVNYALDELFLKPVAAWYDLALPDLVQEGIHNGLKNFEAPVVLANDLMQGEMDRAGNTTMRFVINTTIGVLGVYNAAADFGYREHSEDFGQTLAVWGIGEGPYLVIPILGPSNPRDLTGRVVDSAIDPFGYIAPAVGQGDLLYVRRGLRTVDSRARRLSELDELRKSALDYYAAIRSLYRQRRAAEIANRDAEEEVEPAAGAAPDGGTAEPTPGLLEQ